MGGSGSGRCSHGSGGPFSRSGLQCNELAPRAIDAAGYDITTMKTYDYIVFHGGAWYAMATVAGLLLVICSLLAGLTLAVCGLDRTLLQLQTVTGSAKERQQALVVARMKRHGSWMLCSLIICSVACGESFPFVIQTLYNGPIWVPIVVSTLLLAIFAEIIPQYYIPRQAITWGYYCWPIIWGCMVLTAIISWPISWLMDRITSRKDNYGIFTNDQLGALIKYHERSAKRGGQLGPDTSRIVVGALSLESCRIVGATAKLPNPTSSDNEKDVEKAELTAGQDMIVSWRAVKTVNINESVDKAFIKKIKSWAYSRIPVIGESRTGKESENHPMAPDGWEGIKIFGFLHIKNLVGLDIKSELDPENHLLVKDLPIYPLPIVKEDMTVYALLNLFQQGMSRMAVVIPKPPNNFLDALRATENNGNSSMIWTATSRTNALIATEMTGRKEKTEWTKDYLGAAFAADQDHMKSRHRVFGIGSPKPLGIVTFEDIIDMILQKTSKDEKDFFDRKTSTPPTKGKKSGDYHSNAEPDDVIQHSPVASPHVQKPHISLERPKRGGTLRQRKPSKNEQATGGMDGVDEYSLDTLNDCSIKPLKVRHVYVSSSYTQNSQGGFHGRGGSASTLDYAMVFNTEELTHLANTSSSGCPGNPYSPVKTVSLPTRKSRTGTMSEGLKQTPRHVSAAPILPSLRRVTPFSRQNYSSFERKTGSGPETQKSDLVLPIPSPDPADPEESLNANKSGFDMENANEQNLSFASEHPCRNSGDTITLSPWYGELCDELGDEECTHIYDAFPVTPSSRPDEKIAVMKSIEEEPKTYDGFPPELLDDENKENRLPNYASKTLPRLVPAFDFERTAGRASGETLVREKSFHDDRALLPSQRRALENKSNYSGVRSTSFWF